MEPFDEYEFSDQELDVLLPQWKAPTAPARLRPALFAERPWWRHWWTASIRIPVPLAICLAVLLAVACWQWSARVTQHTGVRDTRAAVQPVAELQPKIIRRGYVPH